MISKSLKVGDKFIDGNYEYEVIKIDDKGRYVSKLVGKATSKEMTDKVKIDKPVKSTEEKPARRRTIKE